MKTIKISKTVKVKVLREMIDNVFGAYIHEGEYKHGYLRGLRNAAHTLRLEYYFDAMVDVKENSENYWEILGALEDDNDAFLEKIEIAKECYLNGLGDNEE